MGAQTDFAQSVDHAAGLVNEATCSLRATALGPLPAPHRALMRRAIARAEALQQDLFTARNDPLASAGPVKAPPAGAALRARVR